MIWHFSIILGRNLSNFCEEILKNFRHQKFILKLTELFHCSLWKKTKQFLDADVNTKIRYLRIRFTPIFSFIAVPWIFLPTSKSFLSKYLQRKLFDGMIFHTMFDQLEMDEKNTVKKLSTFLTPNWSFELCQLPRLKKIEIVGANNVMWYTIQCRQPLF